MFLIQCQTKYHTLFVYLLDEDIHVYIYRSLNHVDVGKRVLMYIQSMFFYQNSLIEVPMIRRWGFSLQNKSVMCNLATRWLSSTKAIPTNLGSPYKMDLDFCGQKGLL